MVISAGFEVPEALTRFNGSRSPSTGGARKKSKNIRVDPAKRAKEQFQIAAEAGSDLGLRWLKRLEDLEKSQAQVAQ